MKVVAMSTPGSLPDMVQRSRWKHCIAPPSCLGKKAGCQLWLVWGFFGFFLVLVGFFCFGLVFFVYHFKVACASLVIHI